MMGYYGFNGMGLIRMIVGSAVTVVLIIGLVLLVVWAVRRMSMSNPHPGVQAPQAPMGPSARDIAQMRYAKGEITREEYLQLITDLGK